VVACVGGGSNAIGAFAAFVDDPTVELIGVEAEGEGIASGRHAATLTAGRVGVLHGMKSYLLQDEHGQVQEAHSISAGLDYPSVGPEHAYLHDTKRATYVSITDDEALAGFRLLARTEGILAALESSHAIAYLSKLGKRLGPDKDVVVCLSGRGDKDMETITQRLGLNQEGTR
jgi:tryptophan synthase beta chain